jgi:hypothetical protein
MLDNLRDQASFQEEEEPVEPNTPKPPKVRGPRRSFDQITGTNARQRFALAVMLSIIVCLLGTMFLVISGKIVPSFLF